MQKYKVVTTEDNIAVFFKDYASKSAEAQVRKYTKNLKEKCKEYRVYYKDIHSKYNNGWKIFHGCFGQK